MTLLQGQYDKQVQISTHTPLAGRDSAKTGCSGNIVRFLLTRPLRDVTRAYNLANRLKRFLLTRPLRDVTDADLSALAVGTEFLLTRPLRDVTPEEPAPEGQHYDFYSHAPCGT